MTRRKRSESLAAPLVALALAVAALLLGGWYIVSRQTAAERSNASTASKPPAPPTAPMAVLGGRLVFREVAAQSKEFIGYYHTITLTPAQEATKAAVLKAMPAACCHDSTAYTCCCPCNLSKTIWGLSNYAIARLHLAAPELRTAVDSWVAFVDPNGFSGTSCDQGRCSEQPSKDGCAGMTEPDLNV